MAERQQQNQPARSSQSGNIGSQGSTPASTRQHSGRSTGEESQRGPRGDNQRQGKFDPQNEDTEVSGVDEDLEEIEERDEDEDEETA